ncbi:MAG: DUF72 domain-containing protein, partial [Bacteroidota bacterium]|nr:DUF72 domain-containing protein [Bacteroidota bacterium]
MAEFFGKIDRRGVVAVWEPRGKWYDDPALIERLCEECELVHCVGPLRNDPLVFGKSKTAYFRLHGFGTTPEGSVPQGGKPSMYRYDFSRQELEQLQRKVHALSDELNDIYVFF